MFNEKITFLISKNNTPVDTLAKYLGCSPQAIYKWCKGERKPGFESLVKIANYFNVTTDYLLGNEIKAKKIKEKLKEKEALYNALVRAEYMKDGEDLSDEELERIMMFIKNNKNFIKKS